MEAADGLIPFLASRPSRPLDKITKNPTKFAVYTQASYCPLCCIFGAPRRSRRRTATLDFHFPRSGGGDLSHLPFPESVIPIERPPCFFCHAPMCRTSVTSASRLPSVTRFPTFYAPRRHQSQLHPHLLRVPHPVSLPHRPTALPRRSIPSSSPSTTATTAHCSTALAASTTTN